MKTYKQLYPRICAFENLYWAFRKARRGKRGHPDVAAFEFNLELELPRLQEELVSEPYRPGPYRHFTLYERKPRRVSAAPFRDRMVHHALCSVIFLGFLVFPDHRRLRRDNGVYFQRRLGRMVRRYAAGQLSQERLDSLVQGWVAHVSHGDTWGLRGSVFHRFIIPPQEEQR